MKRTMLAALIVLAGPMLFGVIGCCGSSTPPSAQLIMVDPQGNSVYAFEHKGQTRYYVVPKGETISDHREGKTTVEDRVPTVNKK